MILERVDQYIEWIEGHSSFITSWTIFIMILIVVSVALVKAI